MNILNSYILTSISGSSSSSEPKSNGILITNIFFTTLITSIFTPELHSLLVSGISWCTVAVILFMVQKQTTRNGELHVTIDRKTRRKVTALVGCILLSGICERVVGPAWTGKAAWWNKAGLPLVTRFLRNYTLGEPGILEGSMRGSKRLLLMVSSVAFLALMPMVIPDTSMAIGLSNIVFQSMVYVLLEDISLGSLKDSKNLPGATVDLKSLASSGYLRAAVGATGGFLLLATYFEKSLRDYSVPQWAGFNLAKITCMGMLGGLRWLCMPILISRLSSPSGSMVDLSITLVASQLVMWTSPFQLFGTIAALTLASFHFIGLPNNREILPQRFGPTRAVIGTFFILLIFFSVFISVVPRTPAVSSQPTAPPPHIHPIAHLMEHSLNEFEAMKQRQSTSLRDAVRNYKKRYGMAPPPNFDKWYEFAVSRKSLLVDEYDVIFHQIQPFWGMPPKMIRERAREALGFPQALLKLSLRNGNVIDTAGGEEWQRTATVGMIENFKQWLPDMDLAFNTHDEPRIVLPTEEMSTLVSKAKSRGAVGTPKNTFTGFPKDEQGKVKDTDDTRFNEYAHQAIWGNSKLSCPPGTPARDPLEGTPDALEKYTMVPIPFITNKTASTDVCLQPSKDLLFWRGSTTGGFSRRGGWRRQHRQRLVMHLNAFNETSQVFEMENNDKQTIWRVKSAERETLKSLIDVNFSHIGQCDEEDCKEQEAFFKPAAAVDQHAVFKMALFREWHEDWLIPWVHYVPLSLDMAESFEVLRYGRVIDDNRDKIGFDI
ncbi:capsule-associated protein CAP1 [Orbilia oligospora]|uniref:Capsule-associated protein CAP1 n=1 Tax=Orbilia oligospora TaxID=2813651 RepID=A0A7C8V5Y0_ORBOL|nr:capsule-associated protein CAP1 [Orbilia oligospora]